MKETENECKKQNLINSVAVKIKKIFREVNQEIRRGIHSRPAFHEFIGMKSLSLKIFSSQKISYRIKWLIFCYPIKYSKKNVKKFLLHVVYE
jgi:hypothetical protein